MRVAVGLRLWLRTLRSTSVPPRGSLVDARRLHTCSFVCKRTPGRSARHHSLNDLFARSFASAGIPVTKEPVELPQTDVKRPDGVTLVSWQTSKSVCLDVTVICPLAESYVNGAASEARDSGRGGQNTQT